MTHLFKLEGPDLVKLVQETVNALTSNGSTFSKHDVTEDVRIEVGKYIEVRHEDVKEIVEAYMDTVVNYRANDLGTHIEYEPTPTHPISVIINTGMSGLGTSIGKSVKDAVDTFNATIAPRAMLQAMQNLGIPTTGLVPHDQKLEVHTVALNKRGLCVPKEVVAKAAKNPSGEITVKFDNKGQQSYSIDRHGNIGITRSRLEKTLGEQVSEVDVFLDKFDNIVVS